MEINKWVRQYKVRAFPWINGEEIYLNVQYYAAGQSIERSPAWDKTVYITDNAAGQRLINEFLDSLVEHVAMMKIEPNTRVVLTA